jgi:hypothetical protein
VRVGIETTANAIHTISGLKRVRRRWVSFCRAYGAVVILGGLGFAVWAVAAKGGAATALFWEGVALIVIGLFAMVWLADDGFTVAAWLLYTRRAAAFILPKELLTQEQQLEFRTFLQRT